MPATRVDKFPLAKSGWPYLAGNIIMLLMAMALEVYSLALILTLSLLFIIWFFRDPVRISGPLPPLALLAPADGRVVALEEVLVPGLGAVKLLSIFMNIFDVHVNRLPVSGAISHIEHVAGGFNPADRPWARIKNERMNLTLTVADGRRLMISQVAGLVAQNIECWVTAPAEGARGQRYGMIRFGSRVDIYMPLDTRLAVSRGQKVRAGITVIGIMNDA
ncbi:MAG: phosphatidylserine decarboxylase [Desulfarculales bacterium]|jgi:phosphatidylserine decarboxylase|nr:phosphatidylserine decarboxylase [Desulfarculales bacterium]